MGVTAHSGVRQVRGPIRSHPHRHRYSFPRHGSMVLPSFFTLLTTRYSLLLLTTCYLLLITHHSLLISRHCSSTAETKLFPIGSLRRHKSVPMKFEAASQFAQRLVD